VATNAAWFAERDFRELADWVDAKTGERVRAGEVGEASFPFKLLGIASEFIEASGRQDMETMVERVSESYKKELERLLREYEQGVRTRIEDWQERKQKEIDQMIEAGRAYRDVVAAKEGLENELAERGKRLGTWVKGVGALLELKLERQVEGETKAKTKRKKKTAEVKGPRRRRDQR
jgi:hypothetical protein